MRWRCNWEPDECTPLSSEWSETILGYCSITYAPDSTNIGWIICDKAVLKPGGECDSIQKKSVDSL